MRGFAPFDVFGIRVKGFEVLWPTLPEPDLELCFRLVPAVGHFTAQGVIYTTRSCPLRGEFLLYLLYILHCPRSSALFFLPFARRNIFFILLCIPPSHLEYNSRNKAHPLTSFSTTYTRDSRKLSKKPQSWLQTRWPRRLRIWREKTRLSLLRLPLLSSGGRIRDGGRPRGRSLLSRSFRREAQSPSTTPATTNRKSSGTSWSRDSRYV